MFILQKQANYKKRSQNVFYVNTCVNFLQTSLNVKEKMYLQ